ncbi:MAG: sulfite exporter TauE/SafE family protein [Thermoplasmata archaeon]
MGFRMELVWYLVALALVAIAAGFIGSLTGIGGGIVIIPVLVIFFNVPFAVAAGASVITILANSATTGSAYVRDRLTDLRIGMFLEIATVPGAILGATATVFLVHADLQDALLIALGTILIVLGIAGFVRQHEDLSAGSHADARSRRLGLRGEYFDTRLNRSVAYEAANTNHALGIMFAAGVVSGMFGIGSGVLKVFALDNALRLPIKVSTATSNFMIGVTACAGTGVLLMAGYVNAVLAAPIALGATAGAFLGTLLLPGLHSRTVRVAFMLVVMALSVELIVRGAGGFL